MYTNSVLPIYLLDSSTKKYQSVGSLTLLFHRSQYFFITAAHVMESLKGKKTFIYFERTFYEIGEFFVYLSDCSPFGSRNEDPIDLAAMSVPKGLIEKSDNAKFITIEQCLNSISVESPYFQALGYPHSKNTKAVRRTVRSPGEFRSEALRLTVTDISDNAFPHKNFTKSFHIATSLTKAGVFQGSREYTNIPDLRGMSGGLLQKVSNYNQITDGFDYAHPAGLILEKKKDNSVFFSLRLPAVFEWLDFHWEYILTKSSS